VGACKTPSGTSEWKCREEPNDLGDLADLVREDPARLPERLNFGRAPTLRGADRRDERLEHLAGLGSPGAEQGVDTKPNTHTRSCASRRIATGQQGERWWLQRDSNPRFGLERATRR
jgi:hypothetical protein